MYGAFFMTTLIEYLHRTIAVSDRLQQEIDRITRQRTVEKGQYLLRAGERCDVLRFVEQGLLRGYYIEQEKEITNWLAIDGEFATSFYSFITREASTESIEAIETTVLSEIKYADLQALYRDFPETERIGRILTENYYIKLEGRLLASHFKTAKERYEQLMDAHPILLQRAPLGYIASYLGISQETLSRIRAQY